ncbi:helix-turn-helix transcriptional regulator [Arsenophonus nasoniae]|uniref:AlpA family phage regulatory protein n=1 Tax=Arsenophonus nasoniae TaxID=638 RepID=A0AA95GQ38_9GAMM|nr:AlpA family phage regulatory protein [Arsenophonus nasoniae]WGM00629.1 AlpA family phage regulatory protein [Arsenophonus nasoniae]
MILILTRAEIDNMDEIDRLIKEEECEWLTSLGRNHRYYLEKRGRFPLKINIGLQTRLYRLSEVQAWIKGTWKPE